ncbi:MULTISPECIES: hypothetical protein [unclassified Pseudomonas]|jgi:hypothetical protein|uniref:hypothetical protein n=1 Tax=unclassified Pseudomonas TaxID=196821 RepID=UPI001CBC95A1|nr:MULTISPECIES: hypothetical protein [unclassified Pseudomonas]
MDTSTFDVYLVNGNITIFCGTHSDKFKNDILNSSLYAELVATQRSGDREASWLTYTDIVSKFKWVINSRETQRTAFDNSSLLELLTQSAGSALPHNERQILTNAFSRLKKLARDSLAIKTIIDKLSANGSAAAGGTHTLLNIVRKDKTLLTLQLSFKTPTVIDIDILDKPVLKSINDGKTNIRLLRSSLDELQYNEVRNTVINKLGKKISTDLLHIPTPN